MAYKVEWLIKDEVILSIPLGATTIEDLRGMLGDVAELLSQSSNDSIHTISDIRSVTHPLKMQDSMKVVRELRDSVTTNGWSITVGKLNIMTKMGIAVSRSLLKNKATSFDTMDEALAHLRQEDSDLSWDKLNTELLEFATSDNK